MGLLTGKRALIMGLANDHSIAWGISKAFHEHGAQLGFSYYGEALEKRVVPLATRPRCLIHCVVQCKQRRRTRCLVCHGQKKNGAPTIFVVHAVGFAKKEELNGEYLNVTRDGFHVAMNSSVYSLTAAVKASRHLLNPGASVITLTYHGSQQVAQNYNVMGVAKAALEASVRYIASDLGPSNIRCNAISAGPIRTLAASGITGFKDLLKAFAGVAPLRRNVTQTT
jgi:enoyl-[acyl-carrier protein] reductase I